METPPPSDAVGMASPVEVLARHAPVVSTNNTRVHIHCNACETYLGIFENEWIRLTSSYARPKQTGIHHGTNISDNTRVVPTGTGQRPAEGCTLSDVICQRCSTTVGQYCREAPTPEKEYLVGVYFYKLSKVTLKSPNLEVVDPIFAYGEDTMAEVPGSPVPSVVAPDPKWSHPPPPKSHFKNVYQSDGMMPPPSRSSQTPAASGSRPARSSSRPHWAPWPQSHMARGASSARGSSVSSQRRTDTVHPAEPAGTAEGLLALRRVLEQDVALSKMTGMMESMQRELRELRESSAPPPKKTLTMKRSQAQEEELRALRAENEAMKKVLRTLPAQMQFENPHQAQQYDDPSSTPKSSSTNSLGKRKQRDDAAEDDPFFQDDGITGGYDDFNEAMNEVSGLATLEHDAMQGYSVWQGAQDGSEGAEFSDNNENPDSNDQSQSRSDDRAHSDLGLGERQSARSRERRQTLPADFVAEEQRYLMSDSNDENFDPNDPKIKGRKHKRTRSAERRRRERVQRQQDSLWKKGVPGGGYENGDGWVEQRRHHSGRFGRKSAVSGGLAVYPKDVNDKLFANGRQIPTTHKRLARELVYLGLDDWIDKDKSDPLYRRTIRVARKHYAYHHGGISSKALCQGKYTRKDLEQVGMWDDDLFEEINLGEESDVEKLDFPLDPALRVSIEKWKKEGAAAKERKKKAAQEAAGDEAGHLDDLEDVDGIIAEAHDTAQQPRIPEANGMTEFSDDEGGDQATNEQPVAQVPDRVERHTKFDAIWQAPQPTSDNPVLSMIQHAEARIEAAEAEMGEPTFKSKKARKSRITALPAEASAEALVLIPAVIPSALANESVGRAAQTVTGKTKVTVPFEENQDGKPRRLHVRARNGEPVNTLAMGTVVQHLEALDIRGDPDQKSFLRELRAYAALNHQTGVDLSEEEHIHLTDEQLKQYTTGFLETNIVLVGGSKMIGLHYWPNDSSRKLSYSADKEEITKHVYDIFLLRRYNKARNRQRRIRASLPRTLGKCLTTTEVMSDPAHAGVGDQERTPSRPKKKSVASSDKIPRDLPFDNGLRLDAKPGFVGNKYYYADGTPKTAEDAARLQRKFEQKNGGRKSLPANGLSDTQVLEQDRARRRATMLSVYTAQSLVGDIASMTPSARESSVLGDSVLQMASAMNQLTHAFDSTSEPMDVNATGIDREKSTSTSVEDSNVTNQDGLSAAKIFAIEANDTATSEIADSEDDDVDGDVQIAPDIAPVAKTRAVDGDRTDSAAEHTSWTAGKTSQQESIRVAPVREGLMTRASTRASQVHQRKPVSLPTSRPTHTADTTDALNTSGYVEAESTFLKPLPNAAFPGSANQRLHISQTDGTKIDSGPARSTAAEPARTLLPARSTSANPARMLLPAPSTSAIPARVLAESSRKAKRPAIEDKMHTSPTSLSDKENARPIPDVEGGRVAVPDDLEPPTKKAKLMVKRGRGRPPRKSAAELHKLAKEAMDRELRSSARTSRSGMYFGGSRNSL